MQIFRQYFPIMPVKKILRGRPLWRVPPAPPNSAPKRTNAPKRAVPSRRAAGGGNGQGAGRGPVYACSLS